MLSNPFLFWLMRVLPAPVASWLGGWLSVKFVVRTMKLRAARARANLAILRPDLPEAQRDALLARRWANMGRSMAELANIDRLVNDRHIRIENEAAFRALLDGPDRLIALTLHLGNWDLLSAYCRVATDRPALGVYAPPPDGGQAEQLAKARQSYIGEAVTSGGAALAILQHFKEQERAALFMLIDERRDRQVWFPRFGRPLAPSGNLAIALRLGRRYGARLVPFYLLRTDGPHFLLRWLPPADPATRTDGQIAAALDAFLGEACLAHPDQWLALHDMDLTRPSS